MKAEVQVEVLVVGAGGRSTSGSMWRRAVQRSTPAPKHRSTEVHSTWGYMIRDLEGVDGGGRGGRGGC